MTPRPNHTPGPWRVLSGTSEIVASGPNGVVDIATAEPTSQPGECYANAALIAAAPDLLAVLIALFERLGDELDITESGGPNWATRLSSEFGDDYRAALAKAKVSLPRWR